MFGHFPLSIAYFFFQHFYLITQFLNPLLLCSQSVVDLFLLIVLAFILHLSGLMHHCFLISACFVLGGL